VVIWLPLYISYIYFFKYIKLKRKNVSVALTGPPASLAEQLKQVLAEREKRLGGNDSSRESSGDFSDLNNPHNNDPTMVTHHLVEEIRQAVNEANQRGKQKCHRNEDRK